MRGKSVGDAGLARWQTASTGPSNITDSVVSSLKKVKLWLVSRCLMLSSRPVEQLSTTTMKSLSASTRSAR